MEAQELPGARPEDWTERVDRLVSEALNTPPESWSTLLDQRCGQDVELRREVESLLFLDPDALRATERPFFELLTPEAETPHRIGPYEILAELGTGGTATVYLARRIHPADPRPVALKVLLPWTGDDLPRRLRQEGEILASLRHPAIAALRGGGLLPGNRPFLVLDYVEGQTLDRWAATSAPSLEARLRLVLDVCAALQHAHGRLVVHGDLKPSNILVTATGEPRLVDFGIARLIDPRTGQANPRTRTAARRLTPEYASPEQLRQRPLTALSDVFSLGVVLYELLTGRRPPRRPGGEIDEPLRMDPGSPGAIPTRRLRGDLEAILGKALRQEPEQRYPTVDRLADDLQRHLKGLPVLARRGGWSYRAGKLLRRHRAGLAIALGILALLSASLVERERQHRRVAEERRKAEQVSGFLLDLFASADPNGVGAGKVTVRDMLDRGYQRLDRLNAQPAVRANFMEVMGEAYSNLGETDRALSLLQTALPLAQRTGTPLSLGRTERRLGAILRRHGDLASSEKELRRAIEILERSDESRFELAVALDELGLTLLQRSRDEEATPAFTRSLQILQELGLSDHPEATSARNNLALHAYADGRFAEATRLFAAVLEAQRRSFGPDHPNVAAALNNLAAAELAQNHDGVAEELFRAALEMQRRTLGEDHLMVLSAQVNLAAVLEKRTHAKDAERLLRAALRRLEETKRTRVPLMLSGLQRLGRLRLRSGDFAEAEALLRRALATDAQIFGAASQHAVDLHADLAGLEWARGNTQAARRELEAALARLPPGVQDPTLETLRRKLEPRDRPSAPERPARR